MSAKTSSEPVPHNNNQKELNNEFNKIKENLNMTKQLEKWPKNFNLPLEVRRMETKFKDVESELTRLLSHFSLLNQMKEPISEFPEDMVKSIYKNYQTSEKKMKTVKNEISLLSERVDLTIKQVFQASESCKDAMTKLVATENATALQDEEFAKQMKHLIEDNSQLQVLQWFPTLQQLLEYSPDDLEQVLAELQSHSQDANVSLTSVQKELESLQSKYRTLVKDVQELSASLERKRYQTHPESTGKLCANAEELKKVIASLSGVELRSITSSSVRMRLMVEGKEFAVDFEMSNSADLRRVTLSHGNLEPCHISIEDISAAAVSRQDMAFAMREVKDRLLCYLHRVDEFQRLQAKHPVKWDSDASHAQVTLPGGIIFSFRFSLNYPLRGSCVKISSISFAQESSPVREALTFAKQGLNSCKGDWSSIGSSLSDTIDQLLIIINTSEEEEEDL